MTRGGFVRAIARHARCNCDPLPARGHSVCTPRTVQLDRPRYGRDCTAHAVQLDVHRDMKRSVDAVIPPSPTIASRRHVLASARHAPCNCALLVRPDEAGRIAPELGRMPAEAEAAVALAVGAEHEQADLLVAKEIERRREGPRVREDDPLHVEPLLDGTADDLG